ncbi:MAG: succinate dehydrogenase iron-sulfur subunit [Candidatus Thermoplasmatota archaeon]|jgi:succinate dehydrogenase / fumarate reductase iron-sulfur subunit|nr:succinate dehydrogenase iron-sulfur subunit [Candidatus Thermoplasmatota archaeon]
MKKKMRKFKIYRYDPEKDSKPYYREYSVETHEGMTLLDAIIHISENMDPSLSVRYSCRMSVCGSCGMSVNDSLKLACKTQLETLHGDVLKIEPLPSMKVIKDLVVDMEPFLDNLKKVKPYLITHTPDPAKERLQSVYDRELIDSSVDCILCGCCTTSCPVFWTDKGYLGPAAITKAFRFLYDSRDEGYEDRLHVLGGVGGVDKCHHAYRCVEACPKNINTTYAIDMVKKLILTGKRDTE